MATINGIDFIIKVQKHGASSASAIAGQRDASLKMAADTVDTTTKDSAGWKENDVSYKSWELSTDGLIMLNDTNYNDLITEFMANRAVGIEASIGGKKYTGQALITGIDESYPNADKASYSISLLGTGALTRATVSGVNIKE